MRKQRKRTKKQLVMICIILLATLIFGYDTVNENIHVLADIIGVFDLQEDQSYEIGIVTRVVDGDTIIVTIEGIDEKVRLIGIDTPESVGQYSKNPEPFGKEASKYTEDMLLDEVVYLTKDVSETDRYDRLLRYVWIEEPHKTDIETSMFNAMLLINGYAETMSIKPDTAYETLFKQFQDQAQQEKKGMW